METLSPGNGFWSRSEPPTVAPAYAELEFLDVLVKLIHIMALLPALPPLSFWVGWLSRGHAYLPVTWSWARCGRRPPLRRNRYRGSSRPVRIIYWSTIWPRNWDYYLQAEAVYMMARFIPREFV